MQTPDGYRVVKVNTLDGILYPQYWVTHIKSGSRFVLIMMRNRDIVPTVLDDTKECQLHAIRMANMIAKYIGG